MRLLTILLAVLPHLALAGPVVDGVTLTTEPVVSGLDEPLFLTAAPGDPRLFIVEKAGRIRVVKDGTLMGDPFLDISRKVDTQSERGLLGLAFAPDYASSHRLFIYYTDTTGTIHVAALTASADRADPASLTNVLTIPHPNQSNHNGGWIAFGPDGYLYVATGDGGGGGDQPRNAQNPDVLLGKMLRLDVSTLPYRSPADNPFAQGGGAPEIFFLGLRNPWRNAFDGDRLYIADVGQNQFEEVNVTPLTPGLNFGWNRVEGATCFEATACDTAGLTPPVMVYDHDHGCSITGGYVYRGAAMPALQGRYFYSDYCTGQIMSFRYAGGKAQAATKTPTDPPFSGVTSFGQDASGELYVVLGIDGAVVKLVPASD